VLAVRVALAVDQKAVLVVLVDTLVQVVQVVQGVWVRVMALTVHLEVAVEAVALAV
jgi:hypothetical protein